MQFVIGRASAVRRCIFVLGKELYCSITDLEVAIGEVHRVAGSVLHEEGAGVGGVINGSYLAVCCGLFWL